ncbi:hypothetical protein RRG08_044084 [Elysia crispata]|uniref:Small EDRK-rich factor-like N-terminal domain-containing protein n=1 Tax=Elysia crispata TaxID=231223 RepID=A0AAE0Z7A2_9GAST|nr:hypothetical protein RRG08_044084 [Elysia crispata]
MTRGNQREKAREKNLKKQQDAKKGAKESGVSLTERRHRDAEIMRQKQEKKNKEGGASGGSGGDSGATGGASSK